MARKSSACSLAMAMAVVTVLAMTMAVNASTVHMVGGSNKWNIPSVNNLPTDYLQTWANNQTFVTGDVLNFVYTNTLHDVLLVSNSSYTSCSTSVPLKTYITGNDSVTLTFGVSYFICGTFGHCDAGQKLIVTATSPAGGGGGGGNSTSPVATPTTTPASAAHRDRNFAASCAFVVVSLVALSFVVLLTS